MINLVRARQERTRRLPAVRRVNSDFYPFGGGLNLIDSPLSSEPGQVQNAINYEIGFEGGYKRIGGYESCDGRPLEGETSYWKLPFGGFRNPTREDTIINADSFFPLEQELIRGKTSGAMGCAIGFQQDGGYGQNVLLQNMSFKDTTVWDLLAGTGTVFVSENPEDVFNWDTPGATVGGLPRFWFSGTNSFQVQVQGDPISVAVGDMLYVSMLFAPIDDEAAIYNQRLDGVRFTLDNTLGDPFGLPSSTPTVDFDIKNGNVITATDHFQASGVEVLPGNVLRLWARTKFCTTADATVGFSFHFLEETPPGTWNTTFSSSGVHQVYGGAPMAVVWSPPYSPHNMEYTQDIDNTTYFVQANLTCTAGGGTWTGGVYPSMFRLTENTANTQHSLNGVSSASQRQRIDVCKGDKLHIEFYAKFTAANTEGIVLSLGGTTANLWDLNNSQEVGWNINSGQVAKVNGSSAPSIVEAHTIEQVDTDVYLCKVTFEPATCSWGGTINIIMADEIASDDVDTFYLGTSRFLDIAGLRIVAMPQGGDEIQLKEVVTTDAAKYVNTGALILAASTIGSFVDGEDLEVISRWQLGLAGEDLIAEIRTDFGVAYGEAVIDGEADSALDAQYLAAAQAISGTGPTKGRLFQGNLNDVARPTPRIPPGSGPIRGICFHNGFVLAFRDDEDGTACRLWKSSGVGWRRLDRFMWAVDFDAGTGTEPSVGDVVEDATTSKFGTVAYVRTTSGTWGVDAAGTIYIRETENEDYLNADWGNNNTLQIKGGAAFATIDGDFDYIGADYSDWMSFPAGGKYEFREANLYGSTQRRRLYWVSGVDTAYEYWDELESFVPIVTGMTTDKPTHLAIHNHHLFLGFPGGSVQLSGDGNPHSWTVITGASEIAVGDEITGFNEEVGNSLFIFTRDQSFVLQGNTRANFDLDDFNINAGAHEWSVQRIGLGMFFDDRGFTSMLQTQRAGSVNFQENTQSGLVQPLIESLVRTTEVTASHLIRDENIYRCYFADGRIVSIGFDQHKVAGHMTLQYPFITNVAFSGEDTTGAERIFVGDTEGGVYELETGTSFDGANINAYIRSVLYHSQSPGRMKKYTHARVDGTFSGALTLAGQIEYDFGDPGWNLADELDFSNDSAGGYWDDFEWDNFIWDKTKTGNPQEKLEGEGTNASIYLHSTSSTDEIHTLRGVTMQWMPRRDDRRT